MKKETINLLTLSLIFVVSFLVGFSVSPVVLLMGVFVLWGLSYPLGILSGVITFIVKGL
jgi:hypothetical protein